MKPESVDHYILMQPENVQLLLQRLRQLIKKAAPGAEEKISYGMPAYYFEGPLVYFGAFKHHVSLFPGSGSTVDFFKPLLKDYQTSKGTIQFSFDQRIPAKLISTIVKMRVDENVAKARAKSEKRKSARPIRS